jgi:hypothetical protein
MADSMKHSPIRVADRCKVIDQKGITPLTTAPYEIVLTLNRIQSRSHTAVFNMNFKIVVPYIPRSLKAVTYDFPNKVPNAFFVFRGMPNAVPVFVSSISSPKNEI